jgi:hypothetical protein
VTALVQSHELHVDTDGQKIALAWLFDPQSGNYWHNGATGGYSAYAFLIPRVITEAWFSSIPQLANGAASPTGSASASASGWRASLQLHLANNRST